MPDIRDVKVNGKYNIMLPKHRADRPEWHTPPYWEEKRIDSLVTTLTDKDLLYYVGAEEGDIAAVVQKYTGCKELLFEPNEKVWPNIKLIWDSNALEHPRTFNGFASTISTEPVYIEGGFPAAASLGPVISDHGFKELSDPGDIRQIKIDDASKMGSPTAITMDIEGSEWQALKGGENTLKTLRPKLWISWHPEFMFRIYGQYLAEARRWLMDIGYKETILDYPLHELHCFYE